MPQCKQSALSLCCAISTIPIVLYVPHQHVDENSEIAFVKQVFFSIGKYVYLLYQLKPVNRASSVLLLIYQVQQVLQEVVGVIGHRNIVGIFFHELYQVLSNYLPHLVALQILKILYEHLEQPFSFGDGVHISLQIKNIDDVNAVVEMFCLLHQIRHRVHFLHGNVLQIVLSCRELSQNLSVIGGKIPDNVSRMDDFLIRSTPHDRFPPKSNDFSKILLVDAVQEFLLLLLFVQMMQFLVEIQNLQVFPMHINFHQISQNYNIKSSKITKQPSPQNADLSMQIMICYR